MCLSRWQRSTSRPHPQPMTYTANYPVLPGIAAGVRCLVLPFAMKRGNPDCHICYHVGRQGNWAYLLMAYPVMIDQPCWCESKWLRCGISGSGCSYTKIKRAVLLAKELRVAFSDVVTRTNT